MYDGSTVVYADLRLNTFCANNLQPVYLCNCLFNYLDPWIRFDPIHFTFFRAYRSGATRTQQMTRSPTASLHASRGDSYLFSPNDSIINRKTICTEEASSRRE
jgi:hypothetical protein